MRKLVAGLVMVASTTVLGAGAVSAQGDGCPESPQNCPTTTVPSVGGTTVVPRPPGSQVAAPTPVVAGRQVAASELPVTGSESVALLAAGAALVAGGGALVLRSRRGATAGTD